MRIVLPGSEVSLHISICCPELGQKEGSVAQSLAAAFRCFVGIVQRSIRVNGTI